MNRFVVYPNRVPMSIDADRNPGISVGCTPVLAQDTFETLYHRADAALYRAKSHGKIGLLPVVRRFVIAEFTKSL
ncbi:MAG: hypothetical protein SOZ27_01435 [Spirochaetia bacterium]|nr:hypothetical protein [Spirochaetia bacterium]